jgi:hypothetical protein
VQFPENWHRNSISALLVIFSGIPSFGGPSDISNEPQLLEQTFAQSSDDWHNSLAAFLLEVLTAFFVAFVSTKKLLHK